MDKTLWEKYLPLLTDLELAIALNTCREAGAVNAANALSKHISRLSVELAMIRKSAKNQEELK